jgi:hypothetical protein
MRLFITALQVILLAFMSSAKDQTLCDFFDPLATIDDGSCEFTIEEACSGDVTSDGMVTVEDILLILTQFGIVCD